MIYSNLEFLIFFTIIFTLYWLTNVRARVYVLLGASYLFYASWNAKFLALLLSSTLLDYVVGLKLQNAPKNHQKRWLFLSLIGNLGVLATFKYFDFFIVSFCELADLLGFTVSPHTLRLVLPVGISFYSFQSMSYTIDIYRGQLDACRSLPRFMLYVAFFPQLVAGPIVRARDILGQFANPPFFNPSLLVSGGRRFLLGFVQKALLADQAALVVDEVFASPVQYSTGMLWISVVLYALQIYWDFAGYSNMAIGIARMLGYELPTNFNFPYMAGSIREFWRRWHITLSTWLRDYLYIPLGGSQGKELRVHFNLMVTMLLGGLWHGASWTFVIWGGYHGLLLCIYRYGQGRRWWGIERSNRSVWLINKVTTFFLVCVGWVWFRAESLEDALLIFRGMFWLTPGDTYLLGLSIILLFMGLFYHLALPPLVRCIKRMNIAPVWSGLAYACLIAFLIVFTPFEIQRFIYFQF